MQLHHLALIGAVFWGAPAFAQAEYLGRFLWDRPEPYFGGLSGLEIGADGETFLAIGDSAIVLTGRIVREAGRIAEMATEPPWIGGLSTPGGARVGKGDHDAEGLALADDGRFFVSFERNHRVWAYTGRDAVAEPLPALPGDLHFARNAGLEALALGPDGALWAIPEKPPWGWERLPVLRLAGARWEIAGSLPRDRTFRPVGADFDDRGRLWLLERGFGFGGFSTRIRRFAPDAAGLGEAVTVIETDPGVHGNLEGLSTWRRADGALILTLLADDNYNRFQVTEIVEYRVPD